MELNKQNRQTMISLATSIISMATTMLVGFFLSPYIVRTLGEEANGFAQLANNFINYASLLTLALNSMAGRFIINSYYKGDYETSLRYYSTVITGNIIIIVLLILPAVYCVYNLETIVQIDSAIPHHVKYLFAFVFLNFFVAQIAGLLNIATIVKNKQYIQNAITMVKTVCNGVLLLVVFSLFSPKIYYVSLVGLALTILTVPAFYQVKRHILPDITFHPNAFDIKIVGKLLKSGVWNTVNQGGNLLMTGLDLLISNLFINPVQMGVLAVAKVIPNSIIQLGVAVNTSFSPNLMIAFTGQEKADILKSLRFSMKTSSILISIPIAVLCVYGQSFYQLWVPSMDAKKLAILSILTCMAFIPFAGPQVLNNVYTAANKLAVNALTVLLGGIVNFVIVIVLLKTTNLGLYAVAGVSSVVSILRNLIITVPYTARILSLKWYTFYKDVIISMACCSLNGVACWAMLKIIIPTSWGAMAASVVCACVVSLFVDCLLLLNLTERRNIVDKLKRKLYG